MKLTVYMRFICEKARFLPVRMVLARMLHFCTVTKLLAINYHTTLIVP